MVRSLFAQALLIAATCALAFASELRIDSVGAPNNVLSVAASGTLAAPGGTGIGAPSKPKDETSEPFTLLDAAAITAEALRKVKEAILDDVVEKIFEWAKAFADAIVPDDIQEKLEDFADAAKSFFSDSLETVMPIFDEIGNTLKGAAKYIENSPLRKLLNGPATCDAKIGLLELMEGEGFEFGENAIGAGIEKHVSGCGDHGTDPCDQAVTFAFGISAEFSTDSIHFGPGWVRNSGLQVGAGAGPAFHLGRSASGEFVGGGGGGGGFGITMARCPRHACWHPTRGKCLSAQVGGSNKACYVMSCPNCADLPQNDVGVEMQPVGGNANGAGGAGAGAAAGGGGAGAAAGAGAPAGGGGAGAAAGGGGPAPGGGLNPNAKPFTPLGGGKHSTLDPNAKPFVPAASKSALNPNAKPFVPASKPAPLFRVKNGVAQQVSKLLETSEDQEWHPRIRATATVDEGQGHNAANDNEGRLKKIWRHIKKYGDFGASFGICFWRDKGDPMGDGFTIGFDVDVFILHGVTLEFAIQDGSNNHAKGKYLFVGMCFDVAIPILTSSAQDWKDAFDSRDQENGQWTITKLLKQFGETIRDSNGIGHVHGRNGNGFWDVAKQAGKSLFYPS